MAHAKLSPSKAYQWSACTSSVGLIEELIKTGRIPEESQAGPAAARGTHRHDLAARILQGTLTPEEITKEERGPVMTYVNHVLGNKGPEDTLFVEQKVPLIYSPEETGTVDSCVIRVPAGNVKTYAVIVGDYKDGEGVLEVAEESRQLTIYALSMVAYLESLGLYEFPGDTSVAMFIDQPNYRGYEAPSVWVRTLDQLREFYSNTIAVGVFEIEQGVTAYRPDPEDACVFCRAQPFCKAYQAHLMAGIPELDDLSNELVPVAQVLTVLPPVDALTETQIGRLLAVKKDLVKWLNTIEELAEKRLQDGEKVEGWKLVQGKQGNRAWSDEEAAAKLLKNYLATEEIYSKSLVSPAQAEKLLKGLEKEPSSRFTNAFDKLITRSDGKPTLAPASDPRPAVNRADAIVDMPTLPSESSVEDLLG